MDKEEKELKNLIEKGENQEVEFKESLKLEDEIGQEVSAFSNTNSGKIFIGIKDSGEVTGVQIGKNTLENLANYIKRHTDPKIYPSMKVGKVDGKETLLLEVK